jgi:ryanodine receptor 2
VTYEPKPIDTAGYELPHELEGLVERLAENAHDVWAKRRIAEGWTYGPTRSDGRKTNPDLVTYSELEESEKEYDRGTVKETLKAIIALGYRIEKA